MPYIDPERRLALWSDSLIDFDGSIRNAGELNYMITTLVIDYLNRKGVSYQTMNDIVGALDNCKDEFRRRIQHPYEDKKIKENSDVYSKELLKRLK